MAIAREIKNRELESNALRRIGHVYYAQDDDRKAIDYYQQSLGVAQQINKRNLMGYALNSLGDAYNSLNDYQKAIDYNQQALAIAREIKNRKFESGVLWDIGSGYYNQRNYEKAISYYQQSFAIAKEVQDRKSLTQALQHLGNTYNYKLKDYQKTLDYYQQGLALAREIKDQKLVSGLQLISKLQNYTGGENINLETQVRSIQDNLKRLQQDAVILYPFVLKDRLELVLVTPYTSPIRRTVAVTQEQLNSTIDQFRRELQIRSSNVISANKLYQPEDSFILLGNGKYVTLRDLQNWNLPHVDLVVLSACETGLGQLGDGREILGFGYQMQRTGAKAAIASLWSVDDGGTQALMNAFYTAIQKPDTTKAEALRAAQVALITGNSTALGKQGGSLQSNIASNFNHPYYWAAFILIGNGL